ncbi:MAG: hypothetical protein H7840_08235 [Alphaproteobacteria bacterium]
MTSLSQRIQDLKKMLVTEEEFDLVFKHFLNITETDPDFFNRGNRYKDKMLKIAIGFVGEEIFKEKCSITNVKLLIINKEKFVHGSCLINGHLAVVMFCPDLEMGMVAITMAPASSMTHFARITTTVVKDADIANFHRPSKKTVQ